MTRFIKIYKGIRMIFNNEIDFINNYENDVKILEDILENFDINIAEFSNQSECVYVYDDKDNQYKFYYQNGRIFND